MTFAFDEKFTMFDVTPVENQFILEQLPGAKGDFVKIYLYGLMHCYHPREDLTPEVMSRELNIPKDEILAAFRYWERQGAVRRISDHPPAWQYVSFKERAMTTEEYTDPEYAVFCRELENAFENKRVFRGSEMAAIYEWKEGSMQLPTEVILLILNYMYKNSKRFTIAEAEKKAIRIADENARTEGEAAVLLARDDKAASKMGKILRSMGKRYSPSDANIQLYKKWTEEWGFSDSAIQEACNQMSTNDPNLAFLDKILQKAYENRDPASGETLDEKDVQKSSDRHTHIKNVMKELGRSGAITEYQEEIYARMLKIYPPEIITLGAQECGRKHKDPESLLKLLESWKERGFTTVQEVENHIRIFREKEDFLKEIRSRWNSREKDPGGHHMEMLTRWEETLGMNREMILKAADYASETKRPMAYLDALMTRYAEKGIRSPEDAEKDRLEFAAQYREMAQKTAENKLPAQDYHQRDYSGAQEAAFERMMNLDSEDNHA